MAPSDDEDDGDIPPYREKALDHYGERCVICGSRSPLEVHHLDRDRQNAALDNLVPLCSDHHHALHNGGHPYTVMLALGDPVLDLLDDMTHARGYANRSETVTRALLSEVTAEDTSAETHQLATRLAESEYWQYASADGRLDPHR